MFQGLEGVAHVVEQGALEGSQLYGIRLRASGRAHVPSQLVDGLSQPGQLFGQRRFILLHDFDGVIEVTSGPIERLTEFIKVHRP